MDADTASLGTAGALSLQRALSTGVFGKVDHPTRDKGHLLLGRTTDDLPLPVQLEVAGGKAIAGLGLPTGLLRGGTHQADPMLLALHQAFGFHVTLIHQLLAGQALQ